ncbi:hypothetical protein N7481_000471 [Penicillium waksmanii]|uniref:uncharacterized protein n=1 Tax=Penicillium waksmanii TaxID=69791 RepID=UPI002547CCC8|nr:uncharacterized protein N7481_000471 [Penicillium waksmanii]KAJ6000062.1 hypothetical protein N7481_000471 [Penicillium waksmanii]
MNSPGTNYEDNSIGGIAASTDVRGKAADSYTLLKQDALMLLALACLSLMAALDGTSISVALPVISEELNASTIEAFWIGTSFLVCSAVFQPVFSSFSDLFGRKPFVLLAITLFFIGAVVACIANDTLHMFIGRSLQGVGGGGIITLTSIVIADIVPLRHRGKYLGMLGAIWSLGTVIGPVVGGCFTQKASWRWVFYINLPFIGIGLILVAWSSSFRTGKISVSSHWRKIDFIGIFLFTASTASFLIPLSWGGILYPWDSWHTLTPLITGTIGLCTFGAFECRIAIHPIIPPAIFSNRTALILFTECIALGLMIWCCLYFLPLYYAAVKGLGPIMTGVALFPETFTVAPAAVVIGLLINYTGQYYYIICIGWFLSTIGMGLLCLLNTNTKTIVWIFLNLVPGLGLGMILPAVALAIQASAKPENLAISVAMSTFFRGFGQSIAVAIGGVIFQNRMKSNLLKYPALETLAEEYSSDAATVVQTIQRMEDGQVRIDLQQAYADSLKIVWAFCCGLSGLILSMSIFTKSYDLNRVLVTKRDSREENASKEGNRAAENC